MHLKHILDIYEHFVFYIFRVFFIQIPLDGTGLLYLNE